MNWCVCQAGEYIKLYRDIIVEIQGSVGIDKFRHTYADVGSTANRLTRYTKDAKKKFRVVKEAEKERLLRKETAQTERWEQVEGENKER